MGGVHPGVRALRLLGQGGGEGPLQLSPGAFGAQAAHLQQGVHRQQVVLIGAEGGGVGLHIGGDKGLRLPNDRLTPAALQVLRQKLVEIGVVPGKIFVVLHQVVVEGPLQHGLPPGGGVDGPVEEHVGVPDGVGHPQGVGAEGQVVVPGQDGEHPILLVEEVVVSRVPQIAVPVHHEHLDHKVAQHLIHIHRRLQVLPGGQGFQSLNEPGLVRPAHIELGVVENIGVALRAVAHIAQGHVGVLGIQGGVVRLVELSVVRPEIPPGEGLLRLLNGQEQPPGGVIHRHPGVATQRGRHLHIGH